MGARREGARGARRRTDVILLRQHRMAKINHIINESATAPAMREPGAAVKISTHL